MGKKAQAGPAQAAQYKAAVSDKAYQEFRHKVLSTDWHKDTELFRRAAAAQPFRNMPNPRDFE